MATAQELYEVLVRNQRLQRGSYFTGGIPFPEPRKGLEADYYRLMLVDMFSFVPMCYACDARRAVGCLREKDGPTNGWFCEEHLPRNERTQIVVPDGITWDELLRLTTPAISGDELSRTLDGVEKGTISLSHGEIGYCGVEEYRTSTGWTLGVFNDCEEWDYLEYAETPDGRRITYNELLLHHPTLAEYKPSSDVALAAYDLAP